MAVVSSSSSTSSSNSWKKRMIWRCTTPVILLLYAVAVVWHSLHPIMSVLSGHWNHPLNPFVDENSIDSSFYRAPAFDRSKNLSLSTQGKSLCDALSSDKTTANNIHCVSLSASSSEQAKRSSIDVVRIAPANAPVNPQNEALVLIAPHHGAASQFAILPSFVQHLAERPWLAKTVFVVAPSRETQGSVSSALEAFLKLQMEESINLPAEFRGSVLRQVLVLDSQTLSSATSRTRSTVLLSPTGNSAIMPNMDLYSVVYRVLTTSNRLNVQVYPDEVLQKAESWKSWAESIARGQLQFTLNKRSMVSRWWNSLWNWICWEMHVATRDEPSPHAMALERGIDSLTMDFLPRAKGDIVTFLKCVEMVVHSMSNAHERLHHNTALFALPQAHGNAYLKHEEFLIPNLLLLIPLIVRAMALLLCSKQTDSLEVLATSQALLVVLVTTLVISFTFDTIQTQTGSRSSETTRQQLVVAGFYVLVGLWTLTLKRTYRKSNRFTASLQIGTCLAILYLHLPIAFGQVALAFPSALCLAPWGSVWSFEKPEPQSRMSAILQWSTRLIIFLTILSCGPYTIVPHVFARFTSYVKYVYTPSHLLLVILWLSCL